MAKPIHRAKHINKEGEVLALCFARPRAIDLSRASWTIRDEAVTCSRCLTEMRDVTTAEGRARLRALAEAATPGPWAVGSHSRGDVESTRGRVARCAVQAAANAAHIAACDPPTVRALLDRLDALERERDEEREQRDKAWCAYRELATALRTAVTGMGAAERQAFDAAITAQRLGGAVDTALWEPAPETPHAPAATDGEPEGR